MSRLLSKTLIPNGRFLLRRFNEPAITTPPNVVCFSRRFSSIPQVIELEIDSKNEAEAAILKKLNEFVRRIIVHNSTPDWLPFAPGSSFWVPPHQITATKIANLVDKVTNPLTEEESLSLSSPYGWPCSSFFIPPPDGSSSTQEEEASVELKIPGNEMLEVKLAHYPDPIYSFKPEDGEE
ncbi:hypothetical protein AtNW77_Chr2g0236991 [Arabidopsis thaliana]|jgi:hypothetical protein|uniref:Expressed protein n=5 Tax=Arabidopsis TaxID=3701 RepID=O64482_ARATH|nr:uncharacterized protein AT2G19180 [Arabidopsis thaliana]NP_565448.1 uncharacterized protein AT2G19180 [Arabidopsis thaliana]KAG7636680.1 hypothetical protein ISN45_At02g012830 [Arabidopsis thaliana x Arabidopsis arenosa]KAG7641297.1 hypothetical protein ISN44_As02g013300 [Arabidopsis suecica]AAD12033.1 expressed protein [Arabidopsis thaliana]AAM65448.1 unknown [Arabidopsis thaliana]AAM76745.1 hypothetical protein [Arabidopsis thaliana]|eukprot:NP_001325144.1 hypothetical protein AT2G19180 [Arabidopsis thaliana]